MTTQTQNAPATASVNTNGQNPHPTTREGRIMHAMREMYQQKGFFAASKILSKYKVSKKVMQLFQSAGLIESKVGNGTRWIGTFPTQQMAINIDRGLMKLDRRLNKRKPEPQEMTETQAIKVLKASTTYKYEIWRSKTIREMV